MTKYLGLDYGEAKIGLAISEGEIAEPAGVVSHGQHRAIALCCQKNKIEKIIIGLSEGKMAQKTKKFGEEISRLTGLPAAYQDETLTSQKAVLKMVEAGKKRSQRKLDQHAVAAALILQDYLDSNNFSSK